MFSPPRNTGRRDFRPWLSAVVAIAYCIAIAVTVVAPMGGSGYPITHSTHFNLSWVGQYQLQVDGGQWYPRWLEVSNYGLGSPTFAFYPPLCMVATLPFHWLGLDLSHSLVASLGLATFVFALGIYRYARSFFPRWIALVCAYIACSTPYFFVDIYQRGAIAETWGIAVIPWLLWASQRLLDRPCSCKAILWVAIAYGCLILAHLPTLLLVSSVWGLLLLPLRTRRNHQAVMGFAAAGLLGGGLTAAYLFPVLCDRSAVQISILNAFEDYLPQNRLMLDGLRWLQPQFTQHWFDRSLLVPWLTAVVVVSLTFLVWGGARWLFPLWTQLSGRTDQLKPVGSEGERLQSAAAYWLLVSAIALLMTTDLLGWVYCLVPPLQKIQFSWRWMTVLCTTLPMLLGYLLELCCRGWSCRHRSLTYFALSAGIAGFAIAVAIANGFQSVALVNQAVFEPTTVMEFVDQFRQKEFPYEPSQLPRQSLLYWHWLHPDGLGLIDVLEYRPRQALLTLPPHVSHPLLQWQEGGTDGLLLEQWDYGTRQFQAINLTEGPKLVLLRTFYYPGWTVQIGDRSLPAEHDGLGLLQVSVPPGTHAITVRYRGTWTYRWGLLVSGISAVATAIVAARWKNK
ncbi:MAG: hypothetical protein AB4040_11510 [Synechococcus sp.]